MALVFSEPGNPRSELLEMRCNSCKATKPMHNFPTSCAIYRRGTCRSCNVVKARDRCAGPLARKLESARVRYRRLGGIKVQDVAALYEIEGIDASNEEILKHTCICKVDNAAPFSVDNMRIKWRSPLTSHEESKPAPPHNFPAHKVGNGQQVSACGYTMLLCK